MNICRNPMSKSFHLDLNLNQKTLAKKFMILFLIVILLSGTFTSFVVSDPGDVWWDSNWHYRKQITIDHTKVTGDLINFPVLIYMNDSDLALKAQTNGNDIVFTNKLGVVISHEIEYYNGTTGSLVAWVKVPYLSSTQDTILYLYYGNLISGNQENIEGTWDTNYLAVQHLEETSGTVYDSTSHHNDGTPYGGLNQDVQGRIDGADYFDGTNDRITLPQVYSTETKFTLEAWIYPQTGARYFVSQWTTNYKGVFLQVGATPDHIEWYIDGTSGGISGIVLNNWYHIVLTYDGTTARIYKNAGTPASTVCAAPTWPAEGLYIGDRSAGNRRFHGIIDEVRLSNIARGSAWIATEYVNQNNPSGFYSVGAEENNNQNHAPVVSEVYPTNQNATYNPRLSVNVNDVDNDPLTVIFKSNANGTWQTLGMYQGGNKIYYQDGSNMDVKNKKYYWSVSVFDGTIWVNNTYSFIAQAFILKWAYKLNAGATIGPSAADVDNDGIYEVFAIAAGKLVCLNGKTGQVKWIYRYWGIGSHSQMEIGDLNNDGIPEIVISSYYKTIALHANNGSVYWNVSVSSSNKNIIIADIDGTGYPYVYTANDDILHGENGSGRLRKLRGTDGTVLKKIFVYRPCYGSLSLADSDNDGRFELYMGDRSYYYTNDSVGKGMQCYDADTLKLLWYEPHVTCSSESLVLADVNKDGILDAIGLQENYYGYAGIYVIDGATWDKMLGKWQNGISGISAHSIPPVYDIDNDGNLELITCVNSSAKVWDLGKWSVDATLSSCKEPPKLGNVVKGDTLEIITANSTVKIYNQTYQLIETLNTSALAQTCVQDLDNNGRNELVLMSTTGVVKAYDTSGVAPAQLPRTNSEYYSERRTGAAVYVPPPGAPQPIIKEVSPQNNSPDILPNPTLCAHVIDFHHDLMNITISTNATGSWVDLATYHGVGNSWYNITTSTMNAKNTTYYWRVSAIDPYADKMTTTKTYRFTTSTNPVISNITAQPESAPKNASVNLSCKATDNDKVALVKINVKYPNGTTVNKTANAINSGWKTLTYDNFENGWGNYTKGGSSCTMYSGTTYAHQGTKAANIKNYLDISSSFYLTQGIDVDTPRYISLKVDFWFIAHNMQRRQNLWVKYYDGTHWYIVGDYLCQKHYLNDQFYHETLWINKTNYNFPKNMKIRFQCEGDNNSSNLYIDQIYLNATTGQPVNYYSTTSYSAIGTYNYYVWAKDNHGNSIKSQVKTFTIIP